MKEKHEKRRRNAGFPSEKRIPRGRNGQESLGKYHKSGLFAEKQNGIDQRHATDCDRKSGEKHRKRTNGGNAAPEVREVRAGQDGRQRSLRSQRRRDTQRENTPY